MNQLIEWSKGNPGAFNFLMTVFASPETNLSQAATIESKLKQCPSIRGTNLYVLYSDLCEMDVSKVVELCMKCPDDVLEKACNSQDCSGRELVKDYLNVSKNY